MFDFIQLQFRQASFCYINFIYFGTITLSHPPPPRCDILFCSTINVTVSKGHLHKLDNSAGSPTESVDTGHDLLSSGSAAELHLPNFIEEKIDCILLRLENVVHISIEIYRRVGGYETFSTLGFLDITNMDLDS